MQCKVGLFLTAVLIGGAGVGCAPRNSPFVEDGPSAEMVWNSPTGADVYDRLDVAEPRQRQWPRQTLIAADGRVTHDPLYFENPFADHGTYRTDADPLGMTAGGRSKYYVGWTDLGASLYGLPRFWVNMIGFPASLAVTPPWQVQESDGYISRQKLGYDHDATRSDPDLLARDINDRHPRLITTPHDSPHDSPHETNAHGDGALTPG